MAELNIKSFVTEIVKALVVNPKDVKVELAEEKPAEGEEFKKVLVTVAVNKDDLGRVIGKQGRMANSIRTLVHACAASQKAKVNIDFKEK